MTRIYDVLRAYDRSDTSASAATGNHFLSKLSPAQYTEFSTIWNDNYVLIFLYTAHSFRVSAEFVKDLKRIVDVVVNMSASGGISDVLKEGET